jgi:hypothetical protein
MLAREPEIVVARGWALRALELSRTDRDALYAFVAQR